MNFIILPECQAPAFLFNLWLLSAFLRQAFISTKLNSNNGHTRIRSHTHIKHTIAHIPTQRAAGDSSRDLAAHGIDMCLCYVCPVLKAGPENVWESEREERFSETTQKIAGSLFIDRTRL